MELMERLEKECEYKNGVVDEFLREDIDCPICKNKEHNFVVNEQKMEVVAIPCQCVKDRNIKLYLRKSGLGYMASAYTFDQFNTEEPWQLFIKETALDYVKEGYKTTGFYVGGQVGAGKSHICTAISVSLMKNGIPCKYILWRDFMSEMKAHMNEDEYNDRMESYRKCQMLYIDDFLKAPSRPSESDLKLAYDLINGRYKYGLNTIVSSEYVLTKLNEFDEALYSRIVEHTETKYCLSISKDASKNHRLEEEK